MRKAVVALLILAVNFGGLSAMEISGHFPNDPRLFSTVGELRQLLKGPGALHWSLPDSELTIGDSTLLVLYTSEGSGLIHEFAYAYQCDKNERCVLIATAHSLLEGDARLRHSFDPSSREISFWLNERQILSAKLQAQ